MPEQEYSESGAPILRYENVLHPDLTPASGDGENIEAISNYIEKNIGKIDMVLHEIVSHLVHIDVHWVKPSGEFPFHTFVTSGMSEKPMNVPNGLEALRFAELCILLPSDWPMEMGAWKTTQELFKNEEGYWPIRWLIQLARFPHEFNTWLGKGHTIPNGKEVDPFAPNTQFGCMLLLPSISLGKKLLPLKIDNEKTINFYCLYPLYKEEMELKMKKGVNALLDQFDKYRVPDVVDIYRPNTAKKNGLFGLW